MSDANITTAVDAWPVEGLEEVERCPACGGRPRHTLYDGLTDRSYGSAPGSWRIHRCETCACAYLDPRPDEGTAPIAYANYYEPGTSRPPAAATGGWRRARRALRNGYLNAAYGYRAVPAAGAGALLVPLLPRYRELADEHVRHLRLPPGRPRLLDVGCGEGEFLAGMQALGWSVQGLEPSRDAAATARARGVPAVDVPFSDEVAELGPFEAVTFRLVFEHIRDPVAALAACRRALVPRGVLWIATPSLESEAHRRFGRDWIHLEPPRHVVLYTAAALTRLLARTGFEVVAVRPSRQARWSFRLSHALALGLRPFENAPPLPRGLALRAAGADLKALRRPEAADVVVVVARPA